MIAASDIALPARRELSGSTYLSALVALVMLYLSMTVLVDWRFSIDLQVLHDVIAIYPLSDDPIGALADNSALVWMVVQVSGAVDSELLLRAIYIGAFVLKTHLLLRRFGLLPTLAFTFLYFFSIDLNQARMSLALSFAIIAWSSVVDRKLLKAAALLALAACCHYPGTIFFTLFYVAARHPKVSLVALVVVAIGGAALLASPESPALRYLVYLEIGEDDGTASFFLVTSLLIGIFWQRLSPLQRLLGIASTALSFYFRELLSLSGRISELAAMAVMLCANVQPPIRSERLGREQLGLIVGLLFFFYRFTQWVVLGHVPEPSNL